MTTATATPRPWRVGFSDGSGGITPNEGAWIVPEDEDMNAVVYGGDHDGCPVGVIKSADAALIVKAANYHDELVAALNNCLTAIRLTREYVGEELLPEIEGWTWFDVTNEGRDLLARIEAEQ